MVANPVDSNRLSDSASGSLASGAVVYDRLSVGKVASNPEVSLDLGLVKRVIARFARGNISAQQKRILLEADRNQRMAAARAIAYAWKLRAEKTS